MANINRQQKEKNEIYIRAFLVGSNWQGGGGKFVSKDQKFVECLNSCKQQR